MRKNKTVIWLQTETALKCYIQKLFPFNQENFTHLTKHVSLGPQTIVIAYDPDTTIPGSNYTWSSCIGVSRTCFNAKHKAPEHWTTLSCKNVISSHISFSVTLSGRIVLRFSRYWVKTKRFYQCVIEYGMQNHQIPHFLGVFFALISYYHHLTSIWSRESIISEKCAKLPNWTNFEHFAKFANFSKDCKIWNIFQNLQNVWYLLNLLHIWGWDWGWGWFEPEAEVRLCWTWGWVEI